MSIIFSKRHYSVRHLIPENVRQAKVSMADQLRSLKQVMKYPLAIKKKPENLQTKLFAANY